MDNTFNERKEEELFHFANIRWASVCQFHSQQKKESIVVNTDLVLSLSLLRVPGKQESVLLTELFITMLTMDDG